MQARKWMLAPGAATAVLVVTALLAPSQAPTADRPEALRYTLRVVGTPEWPPPGSVVEVFGGESLTSTGVLAQVRAVRAVPSLPEHVVELEVTADAPRPIPDHHGALVARVLGDETREVLVPWSGTRRRPGAAVVMYGNHGEIVGSVVRVLGDHVTVAVPAEHAVAAVMASAIAPTGEEVRDARVSGP